MWPEIAVQTSNRLWSIRTPFLAAEELIAMAVILPSLNWKPRCPVESLCKVNVLSNGLGMEKIRIHLWTSFGSTYRSLTARIMLLTDAFLNLSWTLLSEWPAKFSPFIWHRLEEIITIKQKRNTWDSPVEFGPQNGVLPWRRGCFWWQDKRRCLCWWPLLSVPLFRRPLCTKWPKKETFCG